MSLSARLKSQGQAFLLALRFLTMLPVPRGVPNDDLTAGRSLLWYPAVGLLLGLLLLLVNRSLALPFYLQAAVLLAFWVVLTGGLHLDGLADCADAWVGGLGDREKKLV